MAEIRVEKKSRGVPWWVWLVGALAAIALIIGLTRKHEPAASTEPAAQPGAGAAPVAITNARTCGDDNGCSATEVCESGACKALDATLCSSASVKFATDSAAIDAAQKPQLDRLARCLRADRAMKLDVEGATDARGTSTHNQKLGTDRARAVAHELESRGVSPAQLHVVSFGENQLLCGERDEACWARNRRTEIKTTR